MPDFNDRDKRRVVFCRTTQALANWEADRKKQIDCGIIPDPVQVFYTPEEPITGDGLDPNLPGQISIFNTEVIVLCDYDTSGGAIAPGFIINPGSGSFGGYLVNARDYQINISYTEIPRITAEQLNHIATLNQEELNEQFNNLDFSSIDLLKLTVAQESFLISEIEQAFAEANQIAYGAATAMLVCVFPSDPIIKCCSEGATSNATGTRERCIVLPAGEGRSIGGKNQANAKANLIADSFIDLCEFGNEAVNTSCPTPLPGGYISTKTGSVTLSDGLFFGSSQEEANAKAIEAARQTLICLYANAEVTTECPPEPGKPPTIVTILAAEEIESFSIDELNELVQTAIELSNPCKYCSDETLTCSCKDKISDHPSDQTKNYPRICVSTSIADANNVAKEVCLASLDCAGGLSGWSIGGSEECEDGECLTIAEAIEKFGANGFKNNAPCKAGYGSVGAGIMAENRFCITQNSSGNDTNPFQPSFSTSDSNSEVSISSGYLIERIVNLDESAENQVILHRVNGVDYDSEGISHPVEPGSSVYLQYNTDIRGQVIENSPKIVSLNELPANTQRYYPEIGEYAGQTGNYNIPLFDVASNSEDGSLYAISFTEGAHLEHYAERGSLKNLSDTTEGPDYNLLKDYLPEQDTVQFRSIKQLVDDGIEIIDDSQSVDSISFRRVKGLQSQEGQIDVSLDNNAILVRGNGKSGTLAVEACDGSGSITLLEWKDGLIVSNSVAFKAGCLDCDCCSDCPTDCPSGTPSDTPPDSEVPSDTPSETL